MDPVELRDLISNITQRTTVPRERKIDSVIGVGVDEGATDNSVEGKEEQALHGSALDKKLYKARDECCVGVEHCAVCSKLKICPLFIGMSSTFTR